MAFLTAGDLQPFADIDAAKAQAMIDDAEATAVLNAPCLAEQGEMSAAQVAAVKAILREAVLRRNDAGTGVLQQQTTGPFSATIDTRTTRRSGLWPSEIEQLQLICQGASGSSGAYSVDTVGVGMVQHAEVCALRFGADYCSCGPVLTGGLPLYELP